MKGREGPYFYGGIGREGGCEWEVARARPSLKGEVGRPERVAQYPTSSKI